MMGYYFPLILLCATVFCGVVYAVWLALGQQGRAAIVGSWSYKLLYFFKDFFWVLLLVFLIRSFVVSLYSVPTGSLEPTVMPGDILLTTKYSVGLRTPIWPHLIAQTGQLRRGEIIVFHNPVHPKFNLIKRLIGLPGDHLSYIDKVLYINGKKMSQTLLGNSVDIEGGLKIPVQKYRENLDGVSHAILINPTAATQNFYDLVVPKGQYFMMGDNRDGSDDSRFWGFVPAKTLMGQARYVVMNFSDFKRIGTKV